MAALALIAMLGVQLIAYPGAALADAPVLGVAPLEHPIPNVSLGLARLLSEEMAASGYLRMVGVGEVAAALEQAGAGQGARQLPGDADLSFLADVVDYLLVGEVVAFTIADRDRLVDLGDDLADLARLTGTGSVVAHVALSLRLVRVSDGVELKRLQVVGVESRSGTRMKEISAGWMGSVDFASAEFSETMIGHATFKAVGQVLWELYDLFPLVGEVLALSGDTVVIDLDERSGLRLGDELLVLRPVAISNSAGEVVWEDAERLGSVRVVAFQPGRCLCLILDGAGSIAEGDQVRPLIMRYILPVKADVN
jgi:curli biogenesis system outer membrane secretion channel CsgG